MPDMENVIYRVGHAIAAAQGDAFAEYASEFEGYATAAVDEIQVDVLLSALRDAYDYLSSSHQDLTTGEWDDAGAALVASTVLVGIHTAEGRFSRYGPANG